MSSHARKHRPPATDAASVTPLATPRHRTWLPVLVLTIAGCLAYANSFRVPFMRDDIASIEQNPSITRLWPLTAVLNAPGEGNTAYARPILNLSFALNRALLGHTPASYHTVNLAIHILNALLLFALAKRLMVIPPPLPSRERAGVRGAPNPGSGTPESPPAPTDNRQPTTVLPVLPLAIALLWMLHPLQTESVTYLVQRAESLAAFFYLLTLYSLVRTAHELGPTRRRKARLWSAVALFACALGVATKEILVTAPFVALLLDYVFLAGDRPWGRPQTTDHRPPARKASRSDAGGQTTASPSQDHSAIRAIRGQSAAAPHPVTPSPRHPDTSPAPSPWRTLLRQRGRLHTALFATLVIQAALLLIYGRIGYDVALTTGRSTAWEYFLTQTNVILHYLRLALWPSGLCFDYFNWPVARGIADVWPSLLLMLALGLASLYALVRHPPFGFLGLCFFALLAPTSSIMPIEDIAVEHRMYLPLAPLIALVVIGAQWSVIRIRLHGLPHLPPPTSAPIRAIRGLPTADNRSHFPPPHTDTPIPRYLLAALAAAALLLGVLTHLRNRDYANDLTIAADTLHKRPTSARAHYDMGIVMLSRQQPDHALPFFERALHLKPDYGMAYFGRAESLVRLGNHADALADYARAYEYAPKYFFIPNHRGQALLALGRPQDALADFNTTIARAPTYGPAYLNRGRAYAQLGQWQLALSDLDHAARLMPGNPAPLTETGNVLAARGLYEQAANAFSRAMSLAPRDPNTYYNRANARAQLNDLAGAMQDFNTALDLAPDMATAYNNRAALHFALGHTRAAANDIEACRRLGLEPNSNLVQFVTDALAAPPPASPAPP